MPPKKPALDHKLEMGRGKSLGKQESECSKNYLVISIYYDIFPPIESKIDLTCEKILDFFILFTIYSTRNLSDLS